MALYNNYLRVKPTSLGGWLQRARARGEWRIILHNLPSLKTFLEIGPGHGVMADIARRAGIDYIAIESNGQIAHALRESAFQVCRANVPPVPICSEAVDIVYAAHVIEHLPNPQTALLFAQEAHRVLRENGAVFISAPDMRYFGSNFWDADYTHTFPVTRRRLNQLLTDANFEIIAEEYFSGPIYGSVSGLVNLLVRFIPGELFFLSGQSGERLARLRLTFLRNICVIARKKNSIHRS